MKYRPEIDGLRAVAVVAVILFHAGFRAFGGGFVGVDVFFVISGYLIGAIIMGEMAEGTFTISGFYERRARRILPALFLVILCSAPFAWLWMAPKEMIAFAHSIQSIVLFVSNFLFWLNSGYFDGAIELKPFIHTWSLAVEEQFYLFYPLLMLALWRFGWRVAVTVIAALFVLSLGLSQWTSHSGNDITVSASFYLAHSRAWELLLGVLLAAYFAVRPAPRHATFDNLASVAGLALIVYAVFAFDKLTPFPGFNALVPTVGTALVILYSNKKTLVGRLLSSRGFVAVGLISYSAYLWHQPLFAFARIRSMSAPGTLTYLALALAALALGWLSWRYVERPFRNRAWLTRRKIFIASALAGVVLIGLSSAPTMNRGFPDRLSGSPDDWKIFARSRPKGLGGCKNTVPKDGSCIFGAKRAPNVAFFGDSHADALAVMSEDILVENGLSAVSLTNTSCLPTPNLRRVGKFGKCKRFNDKAMKYLEAHANIKTVILSARWTSSIQSTPFNNQEGGVERDSFTIYYPVGLEFVDLQFAERQRFVGEFIKAGIEKLLAMGKRVVLVYPVPEVGWQPQRYAFRMTKFGGMPFEKIELSTSYDVFKERNRRAIGVLDAIPDDQRLIRIKPEAIFCDTFIKDRCAVAIDGEQFYRDDDHLGRTGARLVLEQVFNRLTEANEHANAEQ